MNVERQPERTTARPPWLWLGLVAGLGLLPAIHFTAVDLEDKTSDGASYLAHAADTRLSTVSGAMAGFVLSVCLLAFLLGLRSLAKQSRHLLADTCTAIGGLAVVGLVLSFAAGGIAAGSAVGGYPFDAVRAVGTLAENLCAVMLPLLAGPAALLAVFGVVDRSAPRALGWVSVGFAVVLTLTICFLVPGAGTLPALLWLLVAAATLTIRGVPVDVVAPTPVRSAPSQR